MKNYILLFVFLLSLRTYSQNNNTQAALYNIGLGSVMGGIGAVINKKPNQKLNKVLFKGMYQGALGGAVVYGSKQMVYSFYKQDNLQSLWTSKLVNAAGVSIIENAALNRNFWEKWHLNIGFNRIELDTKEKLQLHYRIMPVAFIGTVETAILGKFNLKYSLQTLTPIFITQDIYTTAAYVNSIVIEENREIPRSLAHEYIHTFQYDDYMAINLFFTPIKEQWQHKSKFVNKWSKWLYMDVPGAVSLRSLYLLENINQNCYFDNFYEQEANFYSNNYICR